jgi:hypothetical protein
MGWDRHSIMDIGDTLTKNVLDLEREDAIIHRSEDFFDGEPQVLIGNPDL